MGAGNSALSALPSFIQAAQGQSLIGQGAQVAMGGATLNAQAAIQGSELESTLALQGGNYSAGVYNSYGQTAIQQANYNVALNQFQFQRQQDALSKQIIETSTHNQAINAGNGLGLGSKSYLAISNSYLSQTEKSFLQLKDNALITQQQLVTEGQVEAARFANQAAAATYQGQVQSSVALYSGQVQAAEAGYQGEVAAYNAEASGSHNTAKLINQGVSTLLGG